MSSNDTNQKIELNGQVAIVTGGGRGIGRAMALALAEADAAVAVVARTAHQLAETVARVEQAGGRAIAFPARNPESAMRYGLSTSTPSPSASTSARFQSIAWYSMLRQGSIMSP